MVEKLLKLKGHEKNKKFIAAQAPNPDTIKDFLRMIFEKKIKCIIMLCKLNEEVPEKVSI